MATTTHDAGEAPVSHHFFTALWAAAALGLLVQGLVIAVRLAAGQPPQAIQAAIDIAGGISWSVIVCGALSLGVTASKQVGEMSMGLLGLLGAPAGFSVAKGAQRGIQWLADKPFDQIGPLVFVTGGLKTAEYALLGYALFKLIGTERSTARNHALLGAGVGLVFGGAIVLANIRMAAAPLPGVKVASLATNEMIFPIGCSILIYWLARLTQSKKGALKQLFAAD
jgi:hypothetical protein